MASTILAACGGEDTDPNATRGVVKVDNTSGSYYDNYSCAKGYDTVDLPLGDTVQRDGSRFSATEILKDDKIYQESVKLEIKLSSNEALPTLIVNTENGRDETPLAVKIAAGGTGSYTLASTSYAGPYSGYNISGITMCLDRSSSTTS